MKRKSASDKVRDESGGKSAKKRSKRFKPSSAFAGSKKGYVFKRGVLGVGYYRNEGVGTHRELPVAKLKPSSSNAKRKEDCVYTGKMREGGGTQQELLADKPMQPVPTESPQAQSREKPTSRKWPTILAVVVLAASIHAPLQKRF